MTTVTHVSERLLPMSPVCTTFRAFGAENPSFDTTCLARVISIQSRFAEGEKTFAAKPRMHGQGTLTSIEYPRRFGP